MNEQENPSIAIPNTTMLLDDLKKLLQLPPPPKEKKVSEIINAQIATLDESITITELYQDARISQSMWYKIMDNKVRPEQDVLLRLAFVLCMSPKETQEFLKIGRRESLTVSRERDRQIIVGLHEHITLEEMEERLLDLGLDGLLPIEK